MSDSVTGASLSEIYNRLKNTESTYPMDAKTFSDWSIEAGDKLSVTRDGKTYGSAAHTTTMTWKGTTPTVEVNSTGNEKRDAVSKVKKQKYGRGSGAMNNQQGLYNDVWSDDGHVHSVISQTADSLTGYVNDVYKQMKSGLALTSHSAALYVQDMYKQLSAGLALTSSTAALYVNDSYNRLSSGLDLTSSTAALYVRDMYKQLKSGIEVTSSSACMYARSRTTRAYIMTRINADGEGEALIEADKVKISGTTTINDVMTITENRLHVKTGARISGDVMMQSLTLRSGSDNATLYEADLEGVIKSASVSNNTLTLTPVKGNAITFSKATTLSGDWSSGSGIFKVTASPQGNTKKTQLFDLTNGDISWNGNVATCSVYANIDDGETKYDTGKRLTVNATGRYNAGRAAVTLSEPTWNAISGQTPSYRTVTVSTVGRTNASGVTDNLSQPISLYLTTSGLNVYMRTGSTSGTTYAATACSDSNLKATNIKKDVEIFGVKGSYTGDSYTKYTFSKTRTQDASGYHYTFAISTGWQAPFGSDGGTYSLYKKD